MEIVKAYNEIGIKVKEIFVELLNQHHEIDMGHPSLDAPAQSRYAPEPRPIVQLGGYPKLYSPGIIYKIYRDEYNRVSFMIESNLYKTISVTIDDMSLNNLIEIIIWLQAKKYIPMEEEISLAEAIGALNY